MSLSALGSYLRPTLLVAATTLAGPSACTTTRPSVILHDPWLESPTAPALHRPTTASSVQTVEISSGSDPLLARAHARLGEIAAEREHQQAYDGLIESLETIQGYMTPRSSSYDPTYRWRVYVNPGTQEIEGITATYQLRLSDGRTFTLIDYHTPSERPIEGQLPNSFPACPESESNFCMVEVDSRQARGHGYYLAQGFHETVLGEHYYHIAGEHPEQAVLLILNKHTGIEVPLDEILRVYAEAMGSDVARERYQSNHVQLQNR